MPTKLPESTTQDHSPDNKPLARIVNTTPAVKPMDREVILLETGKVKLNNNDREITAGVLFDRGSMASYLRRETATKLGLQPHSQQSLHVNGFGGHTSKKSYDVAHVDVKTNEGLKTIEVLVTDEIVKPINQEGWAACKEYNHIAGLKLANDFSEKTFTVDMLIGCDYAFEFLENRLIKGNGPTVQFANIGCLVSGPLKPKNQIHTAALTYDSPQKGEENFQFKPTNTQDEISQLEAHLRSNALQIDDVSDSDYNSAFKDTYMDRIQFRNGHYYVPLPWKPDHNELHSNIPECQARMKQVMSRLRKLNLVANYTKVMQENIEKGYISESSNDEEGFFMPHFPVLRDSETTPLRIVFDASSGNPSLNSCLHEGPNMMQDLAELLLRFRTKKIGLSADIARAFLSVQLLESDRKYVRFLWYKDNDVTKQLVPYHCNTVIFGNVSSPFSLAITLHKHLSAYDSLVAKDMSNKLYVDNLLTGVNSEEEALAYYQESCDIMNHASFKLRQWASNSKTLRNIAAADDLHTKTDQVNVLGMKWEQSTDTLSLAKKDLQTDQKITKRMVTSQSASVFDPLGLIAPIVIPAKSFINKLWINNKAWDEHLTQQERDEWDSIAQNLNHVHDVRIPRWIGADVNKDLHLIIFCDACPTTALGCVAYAKQGNGVALLGSKNKIISQKNAHQTVPKLELMAMAIGASYGDTLREVYAKDYNSIDITYATDSEIALYWLKSTKKLKPFVQNRVNIIKEKSNPDSWYHVATTDNPADILSRGSTIKNIKHTSWLNGPTWLKDNRDTWPLTSIKDTQVTTTVTIAAAFEMDNTFQPATPRLNLTDIFDIARFSSYQKLLRVTALVTRAFKSGLPNNRNELSAQDINKAELQWISHIQSSAYSDVIEYFTARNSGSKHLPKRPSIVNQLGLFRDERSGIIRCGGRLSNANINSDRKYPILLPHQSYFTTLLIRHAHQTMVHYGVGSTMTFLREKYWITSMRSTVKKVLHRCRVCKKVAGRAYLTPVAPPLPDFRLNDLKAFQSTAVDFTAHLYVKVRDTTRKVYVCLFTCCSTRAVHLEITQDLSCESFLRAFRRFTSTYSVPHLIYCDNAKTFTSGENEIKRLYQTVSNTQCQRHFAQKGIRFKYTPVQASWFGGVHERLIGVTKLAIKKTLGKALVSLDELQTLIKEIQSVVNNRPLTHLSADINELKAITPNHLIYGHELSMLPVEDISENEFDPTYRGGKAHLEKLAFRRAQLIQTFRKRFYDEYLASLREKHQCELKKQNAESDTIKIGDVVLIHDKDEPRRKWKLGIVTELHRGSDGMTRSAAVRTATGQSNRAIAKLYPLELNCEETLEEMVKKGPKESDNSVKNERPKRSAAKLARDRIFGLSGSV